MKLKPNNTEVEKSDTNRGFGRLQFKDRYGHECSLQDSSLATQAAIWFGIDDAKPQICVSGQGWKNVPFPEGTIFHTRMHLTQAQVRTLLPALKHFAEHGILPTTPPEAKHECGCLASEAEIIAKQGYWEDSDEELPFCTNCKCFLPRDDYEGQIELNDGCGDWNGEPY